MELKGITSSSECPQRCKKITTPFLKRPWRVQILPFLPWVSIASGRISISSKTHANGRVASFFYESSSRVEEITSFTFNIFGNPAHPRYFAQKRTNKTVFLNFVVGPLPSV